MLVDEQNRPRYTIDRNRFLLAVTGPYGHALHASKPASRLADEPRLVNTATTAMEALSLVTRSVQQRMYDDAVVVDESGSCLGVVRAGDLIRGIAELSNKIAATFFDTVPKEKRVNGRVQIVTSTSFFVPKPFTPFQWAPQCTKEEFVEKAYLTRKAISEQLNQKSIKYNWHEADVSVLEGVLARGDRKLSQVLLYVYNKGCFYDAWSEYFHNDVWMEAFAACGLDPDFYSHRERPLDEILPWDFLDCGVSRAFLEREWQKAKNETISPNCKQACQGCGAARFGCGICVEPRD